ncbi:MAG: DHH family phosphoesterase, partial [Clostridiales bacterium]|nr:DHH family phosphoesterase [Clostridiales bacterium]
MKFKTKNVIIALLFISALCLACIAGFLFGKASSQDKLLKERELLYGLNRASIENMSVEGDKIYVIGHMSPDSDTVCSAITFANLLNELGYPAEAAVTDAPNKETAYILKEAGVKTPPVLKDASGKSIFLVDHSEYAQAAPGMADAHIVGIIDHHGIGSVTTGYQVVYEAKPIGATATIIMLDYMNYGVEIDKTSAYLLLCALLSDTENLTGTTVTESDRQALKILSDLADVSDTDALYLAIHTEKLSYEGMT